MQLQIKSIELPEGIQWEKGDWWIWIGFRSPKETAFFSVERDVSSSLLALKQDTSFRFLEGSEVHKLINGVISIDRSGQLQLRPNPFGHPETYSWRKNTTDFVGFGGIPSNDGYTILDIKRVCKGQTQYRTVRLFDDSPVKVCPGLDCYVSHEPREEWIDEARIEATCQDGRKVNFKYGPMGSHNGKEGRSQVQGYFDDWYKNAWKKIPRGVQFVGNQPPVLRSLSEFLILKTTVDKPIRVDILNRASDPDGDRLTMRPLGSPINGVLAPNPDGSFTFTPKPGWTGDEDISFKASDGLVEADGVVRVSIFVKKP